MDNQDMTPPAAEGEEERLRRALERADAKIAASKAKATQPQAPTTQTPQKSLLRKAGDAWKSAGAGIAKAGIETKDFLVGEPKDSEKWDIRRGVEQRAEELASESVLNSATMGISQMVTGLLGAGKIMGPIKAIQATAKGRAAFEVGKAALASTVVLDPHEARLSDLVESFPSLQNPVTEYLASDPTDSVAEGRFKNAIESLGVDMALIGVVKVIKFFRAGDDAAGLKEIKKLEKGRADAAVPEGDAGVPPPPAEPQAPTPAALTEEDQALGRIEQATKEIVGGEEDAALSRVEQVASDLKAQADEGTLEQIGTKSQPIDPKTGEQLLPTDQVAPDKIRTTDIADGDIETILKSTEADQAAIKKFGTREEAAAQGHKFGSEARLPWQKLHVEGGGLELLERTTQVLAKRYNQAKGGAVLSDERVVEMVNDIADLYGEDPALIIGQIAEAGADAAKMVPRMEAGLRLGNRMFQDAEDLRVKIQTGNLKEFGGNPEMAAQEWMGRLAVALDTTAAANSMLSNSGRALRRARGEFRFTAADLKRFRAMDPAKAMVIVEKAGGDLKKVSKLLNETWAKRVLNEATWHLTNGLLWMWPTHLVNTTTNAFMLAARPTEKLFGSQALRLLTKDPGRRAELSTMSRQALREYTYTVTALADGWTNAVEAFKRGDSILNPHNTEFFDGTMTGVETQAIQWKPWNSTADLAENAWKAASYRNLVGLPTRALGAGDEFFKQLRYRAVVQSKAAIDAADRGLTGEDARAYVQKAVNQAIDPDSGRALDTNAIREAQRTTFQQDLNYDTYTGSMGRGLQNLRRTAPLTAIILPFLKTPINVIRQGVKLTPGLNLLQKEYLDDLLGKSGAESQAHAVGQMAMGSMFMGLAAHLAANDMFTGSGPDDYKLKQELMATGWKPYSIKWQGENGETNYFQLGRFDPVGMAMGMVSDIVHLRQKNPENGYDDLILAASIAVAKNLGEKTFLLNLNSAMEAFLDPETSLPKWLGRMGGAMLPFSSALRGHNPDPYLREARGFVDSALRGVPGYSETLPMSMDIWGDPIERHVGVTDTQDNDLVEAEHNRIMLQTDKGIGKPSFKFEGVDLRDLTLKDGKNAYQRLQELSGHLPGGAPSLKATLAKVIQSEAYQSLPDGDSDVQGTRLNLLGKHVQKYREAAKKVLIRENAELHPLIKARQRDARGAILENRQQKSQEPGAKALLDALGGQGRRQ